MHLLTQRLPRFLLTAAALYLGWYLFYVRSVHGGAADVGWELAVCRHLADASAGVLRLLGFESHTGGATGTWLYVNNVASVIVGWQCDGLSMMALFAGFIIAYPGPWRAKLWFVPMGLLIIHVLNILRIVALALNFVYYHASMEFNHHYTFVLVVYGFIFYLWTVWVRRFAAAEPPTGPPSGAGPAATSAVPSAPVSASLNA